MVANFKGGNAEIPVVSSRGADSFTTPHQRLMSVYRSLVCTPETLSRPHSTIFTWRIFQIIATKTLLIIGHWTSPHFINKIWKVTNLCRERYTVGGSYITYLPTWASHRWQFPSLARILGLILVPKKKTKKAVFSALCIARTEFLLALKPIFQQTELVTFYLQAGKAQVVFQFTMSMMSCILICVMVSGSGRSRDHMKRTHGTRLRWAGVKETV